MSEPVMPIDPFACAQRATGVHVSLDLDDVLALAPHWSNEQADRFLLAHEEQIAAAMLATGVQAIAILLKEDVHGDNS